MYVLNRAVQACYRQRRDTNRGEIEYLMLAFSQFHFLFSYQKIQTRCKADSFSGISTTFGSYVLLRSNICLTARPANGILISDNSLSYCQLQWKLWKVAKRMTGSTTFPATFLQSLLKLWYCESFVCGMCCLLSGDTSRNKGLTNCCWRLLDVNILTFLSQLHFVR